MSKKELECGKFEGFELIPGVEENDVFKLGARLRKEFIDHDFDLKGFIDEKNRFIRGLSSTKQFVSSVIYHSPVVKEKVNEWVNQDADNVGMFLMKLERVFVFVANQIGEINSNLLGHEEFVEVYALLIDSCIGENVFIASQFVDLVDGKSGGLWDDLRQLLADGDFGYEEVVSLWNSFERSWCEFLIKTKFDIVAVEGEIADLMDLIKSDLGEEALVNYVDKVFHPILNSLKGVKEFLK